MSPHLRIDDDLVIDLTDPDRPRALRGAEARAVASTATDALAVTPSLPAFTAHVAIPTLRAHHALLALAVLFTVFDAVATYVWLGAGHGEWNPLLDHLIGAIGAGPAMAVRAAVGLGLLGALVPLLPRTALARRGLVGVTIALGAVCAYHLYGLVAHVLPA